MAFFCPEIDFHIFKLRLEANRDSLKIKKHATPQIETQRLKNQDKTAPFPFPSSSAFAVLHEILHNKYNFMFHIEYRRVCRMHTTLVGPFPLAFVFQFLPRQQNHSQTLHQTIDPNERRRKM